MMMIYMIYAANWVDVIEEPIGTNAIPKGTALEYFKLSLYVLNTRFFEQTFLVLFSFPKKQRPQQVPQPWVG